MLTQKRFNTLMITALAVLTIYYAQTIVMPIIFSGLCAMFTHPLVRKFEKLGINLVFSSLIVVIIITIFVAGVFGLFAFEGYEIIKSLPIDDVESVIEHPVTSLNDNTEINLNGYTEQLSLIVDKGKKALIDTVPTTLLNINAVFVFLLSCPIYVFFMLICRSSIRGYYYANFTPSKRHIANRILHQIEMVYVNYLKGMAYVLVIVAALTTIGLYCLGIEHALFLGLLSGFLTLIPYIGVIISALIPILIALLTKDSMWYAAGVIMVFALVQFLEGNIITPKIMGDQVGVNPLIVIVGIVIFGAIGGVVGMILTIPFLALVKTVAFYIPGWKPLRELLRA